MKDEDWDQFKSDRIKFESPGTTIVGDITDIALDQGFGNGPIPLLKMHTTDGEHRELLAGQTGLQRQLAELKPRPGDRIKITYTGETALGGGKSFKNFEVALKRGGGTNGETPAAAPVAAPTLAPVSAAEAGDDDF